MIQSNSQEAYFFSEGGNSDRISFVHIVEIFKFIEGGMLCPQATDSIIEK